MIIKYAVFWMSQERRIYGDDSYHVLGEWMSSFDTEEKAIDYIKALDLKKGNFCTVIKIYTGN